jgi:hypothetical protein
VKPGGDELGRDSCRQDDGESLDDVLGAHRRDCLPRGGRLHSRPGSLTISHVLLFWLVPNAPDVIILLTLALALYLVVIELREMEPRLHWKWWSWWLSLVFLTHFIGYLGLRGYSAYRRWQRARV